MGFVGEMGMSNVRMEELLGNICVHKEEQKQFKQSGLWSLVAQKYSIWETVL